MRIKWRGLELPSKVVRDDAVSTGHYGRFLIEPFEQGFGTTIGNSLRRVLLSSLEGAAITSMKIEGVSHEFMSMQGILEDVTDIILNVKGIVLAIDGDDSCRITITRDKAGEVRAGDAVIGPAVRIVNPDHLIATLTSNVKFHAEFTAKVSRGYASASENRSPDAELGVISVDSVFSPILRVRYRTEDMRVGQRTNYDRLIMEVWTNGAILPEDAMVEAGLILRKHLNPLVMYHELGEQIIARVRPVGDLASLTSAPHEVLLDKPIHVLNLSVRATNCLDAAGIRTLRELVSHSEGELLRFRSFGKTSLQEVQRKLTEIGLALGNSAGGIDDMGSEEFPMTDVVGGVEGDRSGEFAANQESVASSGGSMEVFTMPD